MSYNIRVGTTIGRGFTVTAIRNKSVVSDKANPIIDFVEVQLDCLYENVAFLSFATFKNGPPPSEQWIRIALTGTEDIHELWTPPKIDRECVCVAFRRKARSGQLMAVTEMIAAKGKVLVSAQLLWFGFPGVNRFFVDFKPGMKERTAELLLAGLDFV